MRPNIETFTIARSNKAILGIKRLVADEHYARNGGIRFDAPFVNGVPYEAGKGVIFDMMKKHQVEIEEFRELNKGINSRAKNNGIQPEKRDRKGGEHMPATREMSTPIPRPYQSRWEVEVPHSDPNHQGRLSRVENRGGLTNNQRRQLRELHRIGGRGSR